jgi:hypothetical protein
VASVTYWRPEGAVHRKVAGVICSTFHRGCCFEPVVIPALRSAITQTRSATSFERDVVLKVGLCGRTTAARCGTRSVPDLGEMPQLDARVMTGSLIPRVTGLGSDRVEHDQQVSLSGETCGKTPGAVSAGRPGLVRRGESESGPAGMAGLARRPVVSGFGSGAAVADGVSMLIGNRYAPGRLWGSERLSWPGRERGPGRRHRGHRSRPAAPPGLAGWSGDRRTIIAKVVRR